MPGGERAALEAVAAEVVPPEAGRHGARLDDLRHGLRRDRVAADPGQGRGLAGPLPSVRRQPDPPEHRPFGQAGGLLPQFEGADGAELGIAVGQGDRHRVGLLAFGLRQGEPDAAVGLLQLLEADRRQLRAPQRAGEADQQDRPVPQPAQVVRDRRQQPAQDGHRGRHLLAGTWPFLAASRRMPARVSETQTSSVGTGQPAARCR